MENFKKFYTKAYQVFETVFYTALVVFTLVAVLSFVNDLSKEREVTVLGYKPIYIMSGSMETDDKAKTIKSGSIIIAKAVKDTSTLKVGDVVTYQLDEKIMMGGQNVTHRITKFNDNKTSFKSKGDSNRVEDIYQIDGEEDGFIPMDSIKYKLVLRANWVAWVLAMFRHKPMVLGLYGLSAVAGIIGLSLIHKLIYDEKYRFLIRVEDVKKIFNK